MKTWIAFLRGVNVGGRNKLPMKEFASLLSSAGMTDVITYIQSGNVVFRSSETRASAVAAKIATAIQTRFGFEVGVMVVSKGDLESAAASNPFHDVEQEMDGKLLHLYFLGQVPDKIDQLGLDSARRSSEQWQIVGSIFYLYAPEGFGTSKLAVKVEKCLGVPATARNWRTVQAVLAISKRFD